VRQAIRRALSEGGIDEETINDWLRAHDVEAEAEEVTQDERQYDNT
jgi:SOS response regulatory protein OraA/RecX